MGCSAKALRGHQLAVESTGVLEHSLCSLPAVDAVAGLDRGDGAIAGKLLPALPALAAAKASHFTSAAAHTPRGSKVQAHLDANTHGGAVVQRQAWLAVQLLDLQRQCHSADCGLDRELLLVHNARQPTRVVVVLRDRESDAFQLSQGDRVLLIHGAKSEDGVSELALAADCRAVDAERQEPIRGSKVLEKHLVPLNEITRGCEKTPLADLAIDAQLQDETRERLLPRRLPPTCTWRQEAQA